MQYGLACALEQWLVHSRQQFIAAAGNARQPWLQVLPGQGDPRIVRILTR